MIIFNIVRLNIINVNMVGLFWACFLWNFSLISVFLIAFYAYQYQKQSTWYCCICFEFDSFQNAFEWFWLVWNIGHWSYVLTWFCIYFVSSHLSVGRGWLLTWYCCAIFLMNKMCDINSVLKMMIIIINLNSTNHFFYTANWYCNQYFSWFALYMFYICWCSYTLDLRYKTVEE